jgi:hypothetical protein
MDHIGIEVHAEESQIRILGEAGELRERRIRATPNGSPSPLGIGREPASSLGSTESEWVARCLEQLGREVIVAGPNSDSTGAPAPGGSKPRLTSKLRGRRSTRDAPSGTPSSKPSMLRAEEAVNRSRALRGRI